MAQGDLIIRQSEVDDLLVDEAGGDAGALPPPEVLDEMAARLAGEVTEESEEVEGNALGAALDDVYGSDRKLAALGECQLLASADGLTAMLRGRPPASTTHADLVKMLADAGVIFGVMPGKLYELLPRRGRRRDRRDRAQDETTTIEVQVAKGQHPIDPAPATIKYLVPLPDSESFEEVLRLLAGTNAQEIRHQTTTVCFVSSDQPIARIQQDEGKAGRDVFGEEIVPGRAGGADLQAGDGACLDDKGVCRAERSGYAGNIDGRIEVVEPVWVSADLMAAYWVDFPRNGDAAAPTRTQIEEALEVQGICHGIDTEAISKVEEDLLHGRAERLTLIARGTDATEGRGAGWAFPLAPEETRYVCEFERVLARARKPEYLEGYCQGLAAWSVNAGQMLATRQASRPGDMGRDVYGEEYMPNEPREQHLTAGANVDLGEDHCHSRAFGLVCVEDEEVRVTPPIWIDPLGTAAYFINLPQLGPECEPTSAEIEKLLADAGVTYGIRHKEIAVLCEKIHQKIPVDMVTCIAMGQPVQAGREGRFETAFENRRPAGVFREDGSVDFRQLNLARLMATNELIGVQLPPSPGVNGTDLYGAPIEAADGQPLPVEVGKGVRRTAGEGNVAWFQSEINGELALDDRRDASTPAVFLSVLPVMVVRGDVCFETGSIDYPGSVEVHGSVQSGFEVKAEGNITIGDTVEDGAILIAEGNVAVSHGIIGGKTQVQAGQSVYTKFILESHVVAGDEIVVCEYIRDGRTQADRSIEVVGRAGNAKSGAISGGRALAGQSVRVQTIGADGGELTTVVAGTPPSSLRRMNALTKTIAQADEVVSKMTKALQVGDAGAPRLRALLVAMLARAKGPRREALAKAIKTLMRLQARRTESVREQEALRRALQESPLKGRVTVSGSVAPNTIVRIGEQSVRAGKEAAEIVDVTFQLRKTKGGKHRLQVQPN